MMGTTTAEKPSGKKILLKEQYWKAHLAKQKASDQSKTAYCREHELDYNRFYYWLRKEKQASLPLIPIKLKPIVTKTVSTIPHECPILCTLILKDGSELKIHEHEALSLILSRLN